MQATLKQLATRQLEEHVRQRLSFSAWEITLALREVNPDMVILHDDVKPIVHIYMQSIIRSGKYTRKNEGIPGSTFIKYVPV